jgi:predicted RNA-binding protein
MYSGFKGYPNEALDGLAMEGVTIVKTAEEAIKVVDILEAHRDRVHSWDTETVDLDIKK